MSKEWKNEDDIKAELRVLTDELRNLRFELSNMVAPPKSKSPSRAFLHRHSWPALPRPDVADDEDKPDGGRRTPKKKR